MSLNRKKVSSPLSLFIIDSMKERVT